MMYDISTLLEHFTTSATHGNQLPDDLQLPPLREVHPAGMDASVKPQANKLKKFVNEDGILHYITKE